MGLGEQLVGVRELAGYSQEDVARALGVSRALVSYWESGSREPSDQQLAGLARLYRVDAQQLLGDDPLEARADEARMLFRSAARELSATARAGLGEFVDFLDAYAALAVSADFEIRGMRQSPFGLVRGFERAEDARRKAEEVRAHLRLGVGPIVDVDSVCEFLGITVFRAPLGKDLGVTISGAFFHHPEVGFSILVNLEMTPGRRRFSLAHELAHALYHSNRENFVISQSERTPDERFADIFAGEFLIPTEGIRRTLEEQGIGPRIEDPAEVVHIQRFFRVSYATALVRLRQARFLSQRHFDEFQEVRPLAFAQELGYPVSDEEYEPDAERWRVRRFPPRFLRLVRLLLLRGEVSAGSVANVMGLTVDEVEELVADRHVDDPAVRAEVGEFLASGVLE